MNDQTYQPLCSTCDDDGIVTLATETRWDADLCARCASRQDEQAYGRMLDSFYGWCGAVSVIEQMDAAYTLNREQKQ